MKTESVQSAVTGKAVKWINAYCDNPLPRDCLFGYARKVNAHAMLIINVGKIAFAVHQHIPIHFSNFAVRKLFISSIPIPDFERRLKKIRL